MQSSGESEGEVKKGREKNRAGRERGRGGEMQAYCWHWDRRMHQMLHVSVRAKDKALHKFESSLPTFWGCGCEILAKGQVL